MYALMVDKVAFMLADGDFKTSSWFVNRVVQESALRSSCQPTHSNNSPLVKHALNIESCLASRRA